MSQSVAILSLKEEPMRARRDGDGDGDKVMNVACGKTAFTVLQNWPGFP